jgi:hypothetical protein
MDCTFDTKLFTARTSSSERKVIAILLIEKIVIIVIKVRIITSLRLILRTGGTKVLLYPVAGMPCLLNALMTIIISTPAHPTPPYFLYPFHNTSKY